MSSDAYLASVDSPAFYASADLPVFLAKDGSMRPVDITVDARGAPIFVVGKKTTLTFYLVTGSDVIVTAAAAAMATTLYVDGPKGRGIEQALSTGAKLRFGELLVTLTANAAVGAKQLSVSALAGALYSGAVGNAIIDASAFAIEWVMRNRSDGTAEISLTTADDVSRDANGVVVVTITRAKTWNGSAALIDPGRYDHALARTDTGYELPLAAGFIQLYEVASR